MRLDKLIEEKLHTDRKTLKRLFLTGQVIVDGKRELRENRNVDSQLHEILVAGRVLTTNDVYYLLNKPAGVVTANRDGEHRTVVELLDPVDRVPGIYAVGRLDRDTEGLLLLTTNGQLGYDLLHPTRKVAKTYEAVVNAEVTEADVTAFAQGIVFDGGEICKPAELKLLCYDDREGFSSVRLTITEGKFHQVKKMFLACGKKVVFLKRTTMGPLELPDDLAVGSYRRLLDAELEQLRPYFR